jgi:hypothetical protein
VKHVWISGRWAKARPGYAWHAPVWSRDGEAWVFNEGQWTVSVPAPVFIEDPGRKAEVIDPGVIVGEPPDLAKNAVAATWVWVDHTGTWHVRTTSPRARRHFQGVITGVNGGAVIAATPVRAELADRLDPRPGGVRYDLRTSSGLDGFDFRVVNGACARFHLRMDGQEAGFRIFLGSRGVPAGQGDFVVCQ